MLEKNIALHCLQRLLRPLVRFCLKHSLKIQDLEDCAKHIFVEEAKIALDKIGKKGNVSTLSIATGVHRREVLRLIEAEAPPAPVDSVTTRVLGAWQSDERFNSKQKPKKLTFGYDTSDFSQLVRSVSKDVHPQAVLSELVRCGMVSEHGDMLTLKHKTYNPRGDAKKGFDILSEDCSDLISAVEENLMERPEIPHLHIRTCYDQVVASEVPRLRRWLLATGEDLHKDARAVISEADADFIKKKEDTTGKKFKVVLGSYSWIEEVP
jgi:hypothetical protein